MFEAFRAADAAKSALREAEAEEERLRRADLAAAEKAIRAGKPVPKPADRTEVERRRYDAERALSVHQKLVGEAYTKYHETERAHLRDWRDNATKRLGELRETITDAVAKLRSAAEEWNRLVNALDKMDYHAKRAKLYDLTIPEKNRGGYIPSLNEGLMPVDALATVETIALNADRRVQALFYAPVDMSQAEHLDDAQV
ncbi:hypothetical protein C3Y87_09825 [Carbonactinospora thermoautotrophica]|nr:hypothetical protein [Carbonactinospora thermoautotrophica]